MDTKITPAFRIVLALKICRALRKVIEKNGGVYHGSLVPNLTSVTDVFSLSDATLAEQIETFPDNFLPTALEVAELEKLWSGEITPPDPREKGCVVISARALTAEEKEKERRAFAGAVFSPKKIRVYRIWFRVVRGSDKRAEFKPRWFTPPWIRRRIAYWQQLNQVLADIGAASL